MSAESSRKRRAIYTGLYPFLAGESLDSALDTWQNHYAHRTNLTLQHFVADLCHLEPVRQQRSRILVSLVKAMNSPIEALLPDPTPANGPVGQASGASLNASAAFALLLGSILDRVPTASRSAPLRDNVRLDLMDSLDRGALGPALTNTLHAWLADGAKAPLPPIPPNLLQGLTNRAYVILCERLGPVSADHLLADAVMHCRTRRPDLRPELQALL